MNATQKQELLKSCKAQDPNIDANQFNKLGDEELEKIQKAINSGLTVEELREISGGIC